MGRGGGVGAAALENILDDIHDLKVTKHVANVCVCVFFFHWYC